MAGEGFEQRVVFRVSRGFYFLIALGAALAMVGSVAAILYSLTPSLRGTDPPEPEQPGLVTVDPAMVLSRLAPAQQAATGDDAIPGSVRAEPQPPPSTGDVPDAAEERFQAAIAPLVPFFAADRYPWLSETERYCKNTFFGCQEWGVRVKRPGTVDLLRGKLGGVRDPAVFVQSLVKLMPLCADDDLRYVATGAYLDLARANGGANPIGAFSKVEEAFAGNGAPLPPDGQRAILLAILKVKKQGSPEERVTSWLSAVTTIGPLLPAGPEAARDQFVTMWGLLEGLRPDQYATRMDPFVAFVQGVPSDQRLEAIPLYAQVLDEQTAASQSAYERATAKRQADIAMLDASVASRNEAKSALRYSALSGIGAGILTLAVVGLFLALLAVERNTRVLRELLAQQRTATVPTGSSR